MMIEWKKRFYYILMAFYPILLLSVHCFSDYLENTFLFWQISNHRVYSYISIASLVCATLIYVFCNFEDSSLVRFGKKKKNVFHLLCTFVLVIMILFFEH